MKNIELHEPQLNKEEEKNLIDCIRSGWISSSGKYINKFKNKIANISKSKFVLPTNSGTSALHIALKSIGVGRGDEILVPTITFVATINAIIYNNAVPIFLGVDKDINISIKDTLEFLEKNTVYRSGFTYNKKTKKKIKAIVVVHVFGNAVDLKKLISICKNLNIKIIEDAAESVGTFYKTNYLKGRHTGTVGDVGCFSFNGNKIISAGGGGAILTKSLSLYNKANYLCKQAKNDVVFFKHNEIGYNYTLSNIHAAVGCAQFSKLKDHISKKKEIHNLYDNFFSKEKNKIELLKPNNFCRSNYWLNVIKFKKINKQNFKQIINKLIKQGIQVRPVWFPNHKQKKFIKYERYNVDNISKLTNTHLCLPSSPNLTEKDQNRIFNSIIDL